jgi:F-type H+-transporting ATPase subunit c
VSVGIGNIFASLVASVARNPATQPNIFRLSLIGFALVEAVALYALVISLVILFAF